MPNPSNINLGKQKCIIRNSKLSWGNSLIRSPHRHRHSEARGRCECRGPLARSPARWSRSCSRALASLILSRERASPRARSRARSHAERGEESARARSHAEKDERLHSACMLARHACIQWVYAYITFVSHCCMHVGVTECAPHTHRWVYIACILALARTYCARMYVGKGLMRALCEQEFVHPLCAPRSLLRGGRRDYQQRKNSRKAQCFIYEPWLSI